MNSITQTFGEVIYAYTRDQAIEDFKEISQQHYPNFHVAMTNEVYEMIEKAANNKRACNDPKGVWHDILWMSKVYRAYKSDSGLFQLIITGIGRKRKHTLKLMTSVEPCKGYERSLTIMLPEQD